MAKSKRAEEISTRNKTVMGRGQWPEKADASHVGVLCGQKYQGRRTVLLPVTCVLVCGIG